MSLHGSPVRYLFRTKKQNEEVQVCNALEFVCTSLSTASRLCLRANSKMGFEGPFPSCVPWIQFAPSSTVSWRLGAPNVVLRMRPPSSSLASTIRKSVIPCAASVRAAMMPATPPPSISTCVSGTFRDKGALEARPVPPRPTWAGTGRGKANTEPTNRHSTTTWCDNEIIVSAHVVHKKARHYPEPV